MLMESRIFAFTVLTGLTQAAVGADICKYTDEDGRVVYSTVPIKNGRKVACFKSASPPPPAASDEESRARMQAQERPSERSERSVASEPQHKVDGATQARRDSDRKTILITELTRERKLLDEAQKRFEEEEATRSGDERNYQRVLDRLKPYQDKVAQHQRNIESIQREIDNLR